MKFRSLRADEIEVRAANCKENGTQWLLYKNARTDMDILDETLGCDKWQRDHKEIKGNVYSGVGIWTENGWVWKWDAGSESSYDKEKGEASDSFKRACVNLGIGRELYTAPSLIWTDSKDVPVKDTGRKDKNNKSIFESKTYKGDITVKEIAYGNGRIIKLKLEYEEKVVYAFNNSAKETKPVPMTDDEFITLLAIQDSVLLAEKMDKAKTDGIIANPTQLKTLRAKYIELEEMKK